GATQVEETSRWRHARDHRRRIAIVTRSDIVIHLCSIPRSAEDGDVSWAVDHWRLAIPINCDIEAAPQVHGSAGRVRAADGGGPDGEETSGATRANHRKKTPRAGVRSVGVKGDQCAIRTSAIHHHVARAENADAVIWASDGDCELAAILVAGFVPCAARQDRGPNWER